MNIDSLSELRKKQFHAPTQETEIPFDDGGDDRKSAAMAFREALKVLNEEFLLGATAVEMAEALRPRVNITPERLEEFSTIYCRNRDLDLYLQSRRQPAPSNKKPPRSKTKRAAVKRSKRANRK